MGLGRNTGAAVLGGLSGGPTGALKALVGAEKEERKHRRAKRLKETPQNINITINRTKQENTTDVDAFGADNNNVV